jgi:hypothetical protein
MALSRNGDPSLHRREADEVVPDTPILAALLIITGTATTLEEVRPEGDLAGTLGRVGGRA